MTVRELIEQLQQCDPEAVVLYVDQDYACWREVSLTLRAVGVKELGTKSSSPKWYPNSDDWRPTPASAPMNVVVVTD